MKNKMKTKCYSLLCLILILVISCNKKQAQSLYAATSVEFVTTDTFLLDLYNAAEKVCLDNLWKFPNDRTVLIEGGGYNGIWLETQPMGGEMYAKRDILPGMNISCFFLKINRKTDVSRVR